MQPAGTLTFLGLIGLAYLAVAARAGAVARATLSGLVEPQQAAEVRAATLAGFTEWYAPAYTAPNGNTCPIGPETVSREFAESDARDMASPEDETPVYVARRLVGPWVPTDTDTRESTP